MKSANLNVVESGDGVPVVLLHGLTATHRYVVMGSKALERSGHRVVAYDARGHGRSAPAPDRSAYRYEDLVTLGAIEVPTVVVADRDESDPGHPMEVGEAFARAIPGARLVVEDEGKSPIAWQGSQLSKIIAQVAEEAR